ncbi:MAG: CHASE3 domain-containing protein, partial [Verrucomicrobia bacterium]|nr:CHASE3 domain-containing protein [Verrucomicrobiota bacterium]
MMAGPDTEHSADAPEKTRFFRRWFTTLLSPRHFEYKLISGTAAAVLVIVFLAGLFLFVMVRNHFHDNMRAHTVQVMRLSSIIENDIAALASDYRGFLLTHDIRYLEPFQRRRQIIRKRSDELTSLVAENATQRARVADAEAAVQRWVDEEAQPAFSGRPVGATELSLGGDMLAHARQTLQALQDDEQIVLNERMREQDWATQSTQILDFEPKLERAVIEMEKEKRGYLLSGDASFLEAYHRAMSNFYTYHSYLSILVARDPQQAALLNDVRAKVERWVHLTAAPQIEAKRSGDISAMLARDRGEQLMRQVQ